MKLLIEFSETKREVDGSFTICGTKADLISAAQQILDGANREDFSYGWVAVYADMPKKEPNNPPQPWDNAAAVRKVAAPEK